MCDKKCIFAFTVGVSSHLNDPNLYLRVEDKFIPMLVNDISAFKMKFKPFISQLGCKDFSKFPQLIEQVECAEEFANFTKYIEKIILIQESFVSCFSFA